jgi:hypothetical protein
MEIASYLRSIGFNATYGQYDVIAVHVDPTNARLVTILPARNATAFDVFLTDAHASVIASVKNISSTDYAHIGNVVRAFFN